MNLLKIISLYNIFGSIFLTEGMDVCVCVCVCTCVYMCMHTFGQKAQCFVGKMCMWFQLPVFLQSKKRYMNRYRLESFKVRATNCLGSPRTNIFVNLSVKISTPPILKCW